VAILHRGSTFLHWPGPTRCLASGSQDRTKWGPALCELSSFTRHPKKGPDARSSCLTTPGGKGARVSCKARLEGIMVSEEDLWEGGVAR
jgi:hypothetical protein